MTEEGSLYEAGNATLVHHVNQALRAHKLFQRDKDYIVRNAEVVIVDEFTGRMMPGRRAHQNDNDNQNGADTTARAVIPVRTIEPAWQRTHQWQNENDQQDGAQTDQD